MGGKVTQINLIQVNYDEAMCGASKWNLEIISPYYEENLSSVPKERRAIIKTPFAQLIKEQEIWDIMMQIVNALLSMKRRDVIFEDLQPLTVWLKRKTAPDPDTSDYIVKLFDSRYYYRRTYHQG